LALIKLLCLIAVTCLCVFRVCEIDYRRTFWAETLGFVGLGIGGFWMLIAKAYLLVGVVVPVDVPALMMYMGLVLVLWSATCHKLRRRAEDGSRAAAWCDHAEGVHKISAARFRRKNNA
jgi:hypothetical protein